MGMMIKGVKVGPTWNFKDTDNPTKKVNGVVHSGKVVWVGGYSFSSVIKFSAIGKLTTHRRDYSITNPNEDDPLYAGPDPIYTGVYRAYTGIGALNSIIDVLGGSLEYAFFPTTQHEISGDFSGAYVRTIDVDEPNQLKYARNSDHHVYRALGFTSKREVVLREAKVVVLKDDDDVVTLLMPDYPPFFADITKHNDSLSLDKFTGYFPEDWYVYYSLVRYLSDNSVKPGQLTAREWKPFNNDHYHVYDINRYSAYANIRVREMFERAISNPSKFSITFHTPDKPEARKGRIAFDIPTGLYEDINGSFNNIPKDYLTGYYYRELGPAAPRLTTTIGLLPPHIVIYGHKISDSAPIPRFDAESYQMTDLRKGLHTASHRFPCGWVDGCMIYEEELFLVGLHGQYTSPPSGIGLNSALIQKGVNINFAQDMVDKIRASEFEIKITPLSVRRVFDDVILTDASILNSIGTVTYSYSASDNVVYKSEPNITTWTLTQKYLPHTYDSYNTLYIMQVADIELIKV